MNYENEKDFVEIINEFITNENYLAMKKYIQHGSTSCYDHCINVAYNCYLYAKNHSEKNYKIVPLVRGAMLHDYFLYDWHDHGHPRFHGFKHPLISLINAKKEFDLNIIEKDIILSHMWPLTILNIPTFKESWLVSRMDKKATYQEMKNKKHEKK